MKTRILRAIALAAVLSASAILSSCSSEDPVKTAVLAELKRSNPDLESFSIYKIEKIESVSFGSELDRRIRLFQTKIKAETKAYQKYVGKGMQNNAAARMQQKEQAEAILERLEAFKAGNAAKADSLIYSVYRFSGKGKLSDGSVIPESTMTISLSEDLSKAWNLAPEGSNKYKGMGAAIPGYVEILQAVSGSADDPENIIE